MGLVLVLGVSYQGLNQLGLVAVLIIGPSKAAIVSTLEPLVTVILSAALFRSAGNLEPWEFYVVLNQEIKTRLAEAALNQRFLVQAPVVIVVCAIPERSASRYQERGRDLYCIQDTAAAATHIMLAATGFGLGTCWVGAFCEDKVRQALQLPQTQRPVVLIPVPSLSVEACLEIRTP